MSAVERLRQFCLLPEAREATKARWPPLDAARRAALARAKDALTASELLLHPSRELAGGAGPALAFGALQRGLGWALAAQREPTDTGEQRALVAGAPEVAKALAALLDAKDGDVASAREHLERLIHRAEEGDRAVRSVALRVFVRTTLISSVAVVALALISLGVSVALRPPDLAHGKPWRTSSSYLTCIPSEHTCGGTKTDIWFHTAEEDSPWFEVDLGAPTTVSGVVVHNRRDCCQERATPLVLELSDDATTWREVARRNEAFIDWEATFPSQTARYVRTRVTRRTILHLEGLSVRP